MDPENYSDWFDEKDRLRLAKKTRHDDGHRTTVSRSPAQALSRGVPTATDDSAEHSPLFLLGIHQHWSIGPLVAVAITLVFQAMFYWSMKRPKKSLDRGNNVDTIDAAAAATAAAAVNSNLRSPARRTPASPPTFSNKRPRLDSSHLVSDDSDHEDHFTVRATTSTTTTSFCTPPRPERRLIVARRSASSLDRRSVARPLERRHTTPRRRIGRELEVGPDVPELVGEWA
jgi:hypothetical protein